MHRIRRCVPESILLIRIKLVGGCSCCFEKAERLPQCLLNGFAKCALKRDGSSRFLSHHWFARHVCAYVKAQNTEIGLMVLYIVMIVGRDSKM